MKLFENKYFNLGLPLVYILALVSLGLFGCIFGIIEIPNLIVSSILVLLSTLIAISLPLYAAYRNDKKKKDLDNKMVYISVSLYVGGEILDNVIEIQDIQKNNQKTFSQLYGDNTMQDKDKKMVIASIWKAASEILLESLQDKHHNNMIMSGMVARIPDESVSEGIRDTYQKMDNLKKRLSSMSKFLGMIISPQLNVPDTVLDYQLNVKLQETIDAVESDIKIFNESAEKTRIEINKVLELFGKEIKIVKYEEEKTESGTRAGETKKAITSSRKRTKNN